MDEIDILLLAGLGALVYFLIGNKPIGTQVPMQQVLTSLQSNSLTDPLASTSPFNMTVTPTITPQSLLDQAGALMLGQPQTSTGGFSVGGAISNAYNAVRGLLTSAEQRFGLPSGLVSAVAHVETGGTFKTNLTSNAGAVGLMQLVPSQHPEVNAYDVNQNVMGGAAYLAKMFAQFGNWHDALAAYNWGPGNVSKYQIPASVNAYANKVLSLIGNYA